MSARLTQRDRILELLRRNKGRRVPSPELARISLQYGARVKELRTIAYRIRIEIERVDGQVHGYFALESEPSFRVETLVPIGTQITGESDGDLFRRQNPSSSMLDHELGR